MKNKDKMLMHRKKSKNSNRYSDMEDSSSMQWYVPNSKIKERINKVLLKLPKGTLDKVLDNFSFIVPNRIFLGFCYTFAKSNVTEECLHVVYLPEWLSEFDDDVVDHTIAHEIAHGILNHMGDSDKEEMEADKMAEEWGFVCPKYKKTITLELEG